jgi:hypothetical protein
MSDDTAADHREARSVRQGAPLGAVLLVGVGLALVGAGALLWFRHGSAVLVDNPVLAALAWCFDRL